MHTGNRRGPFTLEEWIDIRGAEKIYSAFIESGDAYKSISSEYGVGDMFMTSDKYQYLFNGKELICVTQNPDDMHVVVLKEKRDNEVYTLDYIMNELNNLEGKYGKDLENR